MSVDILGWEKVNLSDKKYFKIIGSGVNYFKGSKDYYSTSSVDRNKILSSEGEFTYFNRPSRANMQPLKNTVWFAKMKNTLKVVRCSERFVENSILSTGFSGIFSDKVISEYLEQIFLSEDFNIQKDNLSEGSTQEAINNSKLKDIYIKIPLNLKEQKKIAEILTKVDETIENTEKLIQKYEQVKVGLMQDLLTKGIDENGNIRSEQTHQFKDSPLGRIPVKWEVDSLGKNIELFNNLRKPISSSIRNNMKGNYPYYGATGIIDNINEYRLDGEFVLIGEDGDHYLKWEKQDQTILINGKFNVSNHAHIFKGIDKVTSQWLHLFFSRRDITYYLTRQGAGRFKLNKATLLKLPILIPHKTEQNNIIKKINGIENTVLSTIELLNKLKHKKQGLMQDLLSGKVRVNY